MTKWFTSDLHLGHKRIVELSKRPFDDIEEMEEMILAYWHLLVAPGDEVYVLGDFSFHSAARQTDILNSLPGQKFLVKGNHDSSKRNKKVHGWAWIKDYHEMKLEGILTVLMHYPLASWRNAIHGSYHLHGHSHGSTPTFGRRLDVGVDVHEFMPVEANEVIAYMERTTPQDGRERGPSNVGE